MKLKKLTIHNIASIRDAEIDFESAPLSDSEVFLITGNTGSGKSTILDAICLALYGKTPRLQRKRSSEKVYDKNTFPENDKPADSGIEGVEEVETVALEDRKDGMSIDDARHLLRRNTGEGFSKLSFVGTNGVEYEAKWGVARARKNIKGTLQESTWELQNLQTGHTLSKKTEVELEIRNAIGLDFDQFCKTTMLAQGDFTKFLNSTEDEKAKILEKITGVDIYSKIGAKIFQKASRCESEYKKQQEKASFVSLMSDEEKKQQNVKLTQNRATLLELDKGKKGDEERLQWLKKEAELDALLQKSNEGYAETSKALESDEMKSANQMVTDWRSTMEARHWLQESQKQQANVTKANEDLAKLTAEYKCCAGGDLWREAQLAKAEKDLQTTKDYIEREKGREEIYGKSQSIVSQLTMAMRYKDGLQKNAEALKRKEGELTPMKANLESAQKGVVELENSCKERGELLNQNEEKLQQMELDKLRELHQSIMNTQNAIGAVHQKVEYIDSFKGGLEKAQQEVAQTQQDLEAKTKLQGEGKVGLEALTKEVVKCKEKFDKLTLSTDGLATTMRNELKDGDICPVCGQKVEAKLIPVEETLKDLCASAKEDYNKAENNRKQKERELNQIGSEIVGLQKAVQQGLNNIETTKGNIDRFQKEALEMGKQFGMEALESVAQLNARIEETKRQLGEVNEKLDEGKRQETLVKGLRTEMNSLVQKRDAAMKNRDRIKERVDGFEKEMASISAQMKTMKGELESIEAQVDMMLTVKDWEHDWKLDMGAFAKELSEKSDRYGRAQKAEVEFGNRIENLKQDIEVGKDAKGQILSQRLEWREVEVAMPSVEVAQLNSCWNRLLTNLNSVLNAKGLAEKSVGEMRGQVNQFLEKNPELNEGRLVTLNGFSMEKVTAIEQRLNEQRNLVEKYRGECELCKDNCEKHKALRPEIAEEDTKETIAERIEMIASQMATLQEENGAIAESFKKDQENREKQADILAEAERLKEKWEKWNRLNKRFGDSTGKTFRSIAQRYVLESLLNSANQYMETLDNRYQLIVQKGTFVIMLVDSEEGNVRRSASTLSGGESFLVSLSLALALADIGQRLSVDILFIDEGFGTLSGEPLSKAITTLRNLHSAGGRRVGIISHVENLKEKLPVQIRVNKIGSNTYSDIEVVG